MWADRAGDTTRRRFLKRAGVVTGAALWAAPTMQVVRMAGARATGSVVDTTRPTMPTMPPCDLVDISVNDQCTTTAGNDWLCSHGGTLPGAGAGGVDIDWLVQIEGTPPSLPYRFSATASDNSGTCIYRIRATGSYSNNGGMNFTGFNLPLSFEPSLFVGDIPPVEVVFRVESITIDVCNPACDP